MQNKKSMLDDFIPLIIALIVLVLAFISCTPLQRRAQNVIQTDISKSIMDINADEFLLNYLTKGATTSYGEMTFSDLIILSYKKDDFKEWKKLTEEFLEVYNPPLPAGWNIILYELPSEKKVASAITYEMIIQGETHGEGVAIIPVLNTDNQIEIKLYQICQKGQC